MMSDITSSGSQLNKILESLYYAAIQSLCPQVNPFAYMEIQDSIHDLSEQVWAMEFKSLGEWIQAVQDDAVKKTGIQLGIFYRDTSRIV